MRSVSDAETGVVEGGGINIGGIDKPKTAQEIAAILESEVLRRVTEFINRLDGEVGSSDLFGFLWILFGKYFPDVEVIHTPKSNDCLFKDLGFLFSNIVNTVGVTVMGREEPASSYIRPDVLHVGVTQSGRIVMHLEPDGHVESDTGKIGRRLMAVANTNEDPNSPSRPN